MHRKLNALEYALKLLNVRPRTLKELRQRLRKKGYQYDEIEDTLRTLLDSKVLDEEEFAESFIKGKMRKLYSKSWIKRELVRSGLHEEDVEIWLDRFYDYSKVFNRLEEYASRMLGQVSDLEKVKRRVYAFVIRHGHSPDTAKIILKRVLSQYQD